jgi:predicted RNA binding protein YcfA (HicA-like mRNA interferase family)
MSSRLPRISGFELLKILSKNFDFRVLRQKGSHVTITNDKSVLDDAGISRQEFLSAYNR